MHLHSLSVSQFMRVEAAAMTFDPTGAITIGGANGSGKSSLMTFLELCFGGKEKCPALPVKVGAKKAIGKLTIDDDGREISIEVEVSADRELKVKVRQDGGPAFSGPAAMLKSLVGRFSFNPFALLKLTGQEQRRVMLDCLGVNFDDLEKQASDLKEERKLVGRDRSGRERQLASMPQHDGVPAREIMTSEVAQELQRAVAHNDKCRKFAEAAQEWVAEVDEAAQQVKELEAQLQEAHTRLANAKDEAEKSKAAAAKLKPIDLAPLQAKLRDADAVNLKVRQNAARAALSQQFEKDQERYRTLGEQLDAIEAEKQERLNAAKCPVKGLEFRDDGVWYAGIPLSQDMESGQMIRAVQLSAALNPRLRTICIDNGERMLAGKLAELNAWAEANDYQVIIFRASESAAGCEFYIQDGKVTSN